MQAWIRAVWIASLLAAGAWTAGLPAWADDYDIFNTFCRDSFGAEKEPLAYSTFGSTLAEVPGGGWTRASRNALGVAWETSLPATGRVEYGLTAAYGQSTAADDRPYYHHLHVIGNLAASTTYHYRLVSVDERGNTLASGDRTLATPALSAAIAVPGTLGSAPFWLDQDNATYVLTQDITAPSTAFNVHGTNITIDLNGHTVTYDQVSGAADVTTDSTYWATLGPHAVREGYNSSVSVYNGRILQGAGLSTGTVPGSDAYENAMAQPVYGADEIAGVMFEYASDHNTGLTYAGNIHHCVITDRGSVIHNRHMGVSAAESAETIHHTLIKRARHKGLTSVQASDNELYLDSQATNSMGLNALQAGQTYARNKIFGTGYHVVAVGWNLNNTDNVTVRDNFIHLVGQAPKPGWTEYGDQVSLNGMRLTQYGGSEVVWRNWLYENNVVSILVKGSAYLDGAWRACEGRGIQLASDPTVYNFVVRNNIFKVLADESDPHITNASCVVTQGLSDRMDTAEPILYQGNTLIANFTNVRFGDYYTSGSNHRFERCAFIKTGAHPEYHTFYGGFWTQNSARHVVQDGVFSGGAAPDSIAWEGSGTRDYTVAWTLDVTTSPGATVIAKDALSQQEYVGLADASGKAYVPLAQWTMHPNAANENVSDTRNAHAITVKKNGLAGSASVSVTHAGQTLTLYPTTAQGANLPPVVALTSPAASLTIPPYTEITLLANASDSDGAVTQVECLINGTVLGTDTAAPYRWTTLITTPGTYVITVRATDDQGATAATAGITVTSEAQTIRSHWAFDEGSGATAHDTLGTAHGTVVGAQWAADRSGAGGKALAFNGVNDAVTLPGTGFSGNQGEVTVALWVNPSAWGSGRTLFDESNGEYWQFNITDSAWRTRDSSTGETGARNNDLALPAVPNGAWHHLAFVYSVSAGSKTIYLDGQAVAATTVSVDRLTSGRSDAAIGASVDGSPFSGTLDEVYFFNQALAPAEIRNLMQGVLPITAGGDPQALTQGREVLAYPNPARGWIYFALQESAADKVVIGIYNPAGERIARVEQTQPGQVIRWDAPNVAPGLYYYRVQITKDGRTYALKPRKFALLR